MPTRSPAARCSALATFLKDNYLYRYAGAKLGLYGNSKQDAIYFGYFVDASHQPLDASKTTYELHFAKGDLPPNKAFWSLTMYDGKTQLLVANPLNRYLLNSTTLKSYKYGPDGSLPSTFQKDSPGKAEGIELATCARRSVLCHLPRLYAGRSVINSTWKKPQMQAVPRSKA